MIWFVNLTLSSQVGDLEVGLANDKKKEVDAGVNLNVFMNFSNSGTLAKNVEVQLKTKGEGWKFLGDYSNILIEKQSKLNKIIGIHVPNNLKAGEFSIELEAYDKSTQRSLGGMNVPLLVKPHLEFEIQKLNGTSYVFAGDTVNARFIILNKSNLDIEIKTSLIFQQEFKNKTIRISKDSSEILNMSVRTSKDIETYTQQSLIMVAAIKDDPESEQSVYHSFDLFPSNKIKFDKFNRFPIKVTGIGVTSNRFGNRIYSGMFEAIGAGFLDMEKHKRLEFNLRGPNQSGDPLLGQNDQYFLKYSTPILDLSVGDVNYNLSELTESSRNGRGGMAILNFKKIAFGGFYNQPRYYPGIRYVYSAFSNYTFDTENMVSAGYLTKNDTTNKSVQLFSIKGVNRPFNWARTNYELALGNRENTLSKAYSGSMALRLGIASTHFSYTFADAMFPGFVTNTKRLVFVFVTNPGNIASAKV